MCGMGARGEIKASIGFGEERSVSSEARLRSELSIFHQGGWLGVYALAAFAAIRYLLQRTRD